MVKKRFLRPKYRNNATRDLSHSLEFSSLTYARELLVAGGFGLAVSRPAGATSTVLLVCSNLQN